MIEYPVNNEEVFLKIKNIINEDEFEPLRYPQRYLKIKNIKQFNFDDKIAYLKCELEQSEIKLFMIRKVERDIFTMPNTLENIPIKINLLNIEKNKIKNVIDTLKNELQNKIDTYELVDNKYANKTLSEWEYEFSIPSRSTATFDYYIENLNDNQKLELNLLILDPIWDTIEFTDSEREKILDISKSTSWDNEINDKEYELSQINSQILELDEIINPSTPSPIPSYKNDSQLTLTPNPSMSP